MKIDLNKSVIGLDGEELKNSNIGKVVANALVSSNSGDPLKFMHWATKLYDGEELDLDPVDFQVLRDFIYNNDNFTNLLKARALENIK